jgi:hypothetical protein
MIKMVLAAAVVALGADITERSGFQAGILITISNGKAYLLDMLASKDVGIRAFCNDVYFPKIGQRKGNIGVFGREVNGNSKVTWGIGMNHGAETRVLPLFRSMRFGNGGGDKICVFKMCL